MPSRNIVKQYVDETYYHAYNRGVNRRNIFVDDQDYRVFLNLLKRYLGEEIAYDKSGRPYPNYFKDIELLAYCLMPNHFHLFLYQIHERSMSKFMQSAMTSYTRYFNKRHGRLGGLFQDRFKASDIQTEAYFSHISRYIHLNPIDIGATWRDYPYSSLKYYLGDKKASWVKPHKIIEYFDDSAANYLEFLNDYVGYKLELDEVKHELANT